MYLSIAEWRERRAEDKSSLATSVTFKASPTVIALGVVSLLTDISSESVAAVLPLYITGALGLSMVAYGLFEGMHQSISAIVRIGAGYTADRTNRPKPVAVGGYGLSMLARIGLLFATGFAGITAVIGLDRIGKGIRTAPRDAMIQQASQPQHLARSFGLHRMLDTVGATLGPLLAFVVLALVPEGYRVVFVVSLAAAVLGMAVLTLLVPNRPLHGNGSGIDQHSAYPAPATRRNKMSRTPRPKLRDLTRDGLGRVLISAGLLGLLTVGDGFVYLALMSHGNLDIFWFPLLFVGANAVFLLLAVPLGKLADRTSRWKLFACGHLFLALAYLCAAFGGSTSMVLLTLALIGIFYAATDGVLAALAGQLSPAGSTSTGIGAAQTVTALSRLVSATTFGLLWVLVGPSKALLGVALILVLLVPIAWFLLRGVASHTERLVTE